jgi:hypothetical protein
VEARPPALRTKGRLSPSTVTLAKTGPVQLQRYTYICTIRSEHCLEFQCRRCPTFGLPSGQQVAKAMRIEPLSKTDLSAVKPLGFDGATPLWFYILKESELKAEGKALGPVGARIVAEVFIGLLQGDPTSYLRQNPNWKPTLGQGRDFKMADLLRFSGVA